VNFADCMLLQLLHATPSGGLPWQLLALHWMQDRPTSIDRRDRPIGYFRNTVQYLHTIGTQNDRPWTNIKERCDVWLL